MESCFQKIKNKRFKCGETNITDLIKQREVNQNTHRSMKRKLHVTGNLLKRIGLEGELDGHSGCVNCLEWNSTGSLLVSSSDDTHIVMWDPFRKKMLHKFKTVHEGNIFGTKFLLSSSDTKLITGAADYKIVLQDIIMKETLSICTCPSARVKRIETSYDMPYVYWSASEDGVIRQTDTRVSHVCNTTANNIFIDMKNHGTYVSEAKCLAINPTRPELLAVGANDRFVRLYDRRMISVTSGQKLEIWSQTTPCREPLRNVEDNVPMGSVQYYTPGHLRAKLCNSRYRCVSVTYVAFSPDGRELLANYGNEQIYLFDITKQHLPRYFTVPELYTQQQECTTKNGNRGPSYSMSPCEFFGNDGNTKDNVNDGSEENEEDKKENSNDKTEEKDSLPKDIEHLKNLANEYFKMKKFTQAIDVYNHAILLCNTNAILYCNRAASLMKRDWRGDLYAATRDCFKALELNPNYMKALFRLTRCYYELKKSVQAKQCMEIFVKKFPKSSLAPACKALEKDINAAYIKATSGGCPKSMQIAMKISRQEREWQERAFDYERHYCGHCNTTTDIKEANFFGSNGQYIVAGSDEGSIYFWDRLTESIEYVLNGDVSIVNCVQPHKEMCFLASSGIEPVIRLWSPRCEDGSVNDRVVVNINSATQNNQRRMCTDPLEIIFRSRHSTSSSDDTGYEEPVLTCRPN